MTGDRRYTDAAMVFFREMRDKMREGPFIGTGNYTARFHAACARRVRRAWPGWTWSTAEHLVRRQHPVLLRRRLDRRGLPRAARRVAIGINLHAFEALLSLYDATKSEEVWYQIAQELKAIERLYNYKIGYLPESYDEE